MSARATPGLQQRGAGLVELAIATLLGTLLVAGVLVAQQRARKAAAAADTVARLQDAGRLALDAIEADMRMASYWGFVSRPALIANRATAGQPLPAPFSAAQGVRIDLCGGPASRWAIDLEAYVDGSDDAYGLACAAVGEPRAGADTLVIRRAAEAFPAALTAGRIHLQSSRGQGTLYVPAAGCTNPLRAECLPEGYAPRDSTARALVAHAYYVSNRSTGRPDVPSLRRKSLGNVDAVRVADAVSDEEIVAGIEDLQVRFAVDTDGDLSVDGHADPGAVPSGATVVAATVWLRIRSEAPSPEYVDRTAYQYGSMAEPFVPGDGFRRIVASRTVALRNVSP